MYQPNYGYQYPYYGAQPPMPDNLAQLRMNTNQMQNAVVQPSMPSQPVQAQPAQQSSQIIWVSGEAGAKSYLVAPGNAETVNLDNFVTRKEFDELKAYIASQPTPKKTKNNLTEVTENV